MYRIVPDKMTQEIEDLKKLSPEDRVKRLRELEQQRKNEIEEAHQLLEDSLVELKSQVPRENRSVQLNQALEQTVEQEAPPELPINESEPNHLAYVTQLSQRPLGDLADQREYLANQIQNGDISSAYDQEKALGNAYTLREAAEAKLSYFSSKRDIVGPGYIQKIQAEVNASASLIESLKRDYQR